MKVFNSGNPTHPGIFRDPFGTTGLESWAGPMPPHAPVLIDGPSTIINNKHRNLQLVMKTGDQRRCVILIHGFNSSKERVEKVYAEITRKFYEDPEYQIGTEVVGFRWPSDGSALRYFADLADAHKAALPLRDLIYELRQDYGAQEIHLVAHSMGCEVALETMAQCIPDSITTVTLLGADVKARDMAIDGKWGLLHRAIKSLHCYYSASDNVLGFWARLVPGRGFRRLGQIGLPSGKPSNFHNWPAESIHQAPVYHDTYRVSDRIIHAIAQGFGMKR